MTRTSRSWRRPLVAVFCTLATVAGVTVLAGLVSADAAAPTKAEMIAMTPSWVAVDSDGDVYIADAGGAVVRRVDPTGQNVAVIAGNPGAPGVPEAGLAKKQPLSAPSSVALDALGNLFIADAGASQVVAKVSAGGALSIVAGIPGAITGVPTTGPALASPLEAPAGIAPTGDGGFFVADSMHGVIERVDPAGNLSIVAGIPMTLGPFGDLRGDGSATSSPLALPAGLALDSDGNLFIADSANGLVEKVETSTGHISKVAGDPSRSGVPIDDSPALDNRMVLPVGLAFDGDGNLYVSDAVANVVVRIDPLGTLTIVAGNGERGAPVEGPARESRLDGPSGIAIDDDRGLLYIADSYNNVVEVVDLDTNELKVFAGTGDGIRELRVPAPAPFIANVPAHGELDDGDGGGAFIYEVQPHLADGAATVTTSTPGVCKVYDDQPIVEFLGDGVCTLTAHQPEGRAFLGTDGRPQAIAVGSVALPVEPTAPVITNIPPKGTVGQGFTAIVASDSDGDSSVTSSTPADCTVGGDGVTVSFVGTGTCTLTAHVADSSVFSARHGAPQSFAVVKSSGGSGGALPPVDRIDGVDRYETAAKLSKSHFQPGVPVAYVVTGASFPDGLAGGPPAAMGGGPVLFAMRDAIPAPTSAELHRLRPGRIVVLGGPDAISDEVVAALGAFTTGGVTRIGGDTRYDTAAQVSAAVFSGGAAAPVSGAAIPKPTVVYIANGETFADALSGAPAAGSEHGPLLLVQATSIPDSTIAELQRLQPARIVILGGEDAVSAEVESLLRAYAPDVSRAQGPTRFDTAVAVANRFGTGVPVVYLTTAWNFPDAVAAGATGGLLSAPILFVEPTCIPPAVNAAIDRLAPARIVILGGPDAVGPGVEQRVLCPAG